MQISNKDANSYNELCKLTLDMSIRIMDRLAKMKVLNKKQSADLNYEIQDAITEEIEIVLNRRSLKEKD